MLARYPFNISDANTGLGGFLLQVKGADVRLEQGGRHLEGKLVAVQASQRVTAPQTASADYRLTLLLRDNSLQTIESTSVRKTAAFRDGHRSTTPPARPGRT